MADKKGIFRSPGNIILMPNQSVKEQINSELQMTA